MTDGTFGIGDVVWSWSCPDCDSDLADDGQPGLWCYNCRRYFAAGDGAGS